MSGCYHDQGGGEERPGKRETGPGNLRGLKKGDDQDGADVVCDGERGEENLERSGHTIAEQGEHSERKSDVGHHRHAPTGRPGPVRLKRK